LVRVGGGATVGVGAIVGDGVGVVGSRVKVGIGVAGGAVGTGLGLGSVTAGCGQDEAPTAPMTTPTTSAARTDATAFRLETTR
jgi:hypothetical protein